MNVRRNIAGLLVLVLAFSLSACGQGKPVPTLPPLDEIPASRTTYIEEDQAPRETKTIYMKRSFPMG